MTSSISQLIYSNSNIELFVMKSLTRHIQCDWSEMCLDDQHSNKDALTSGTRILSSYSIPATLGLTEKKLWLITDAEYEGDRYITTILFPSEY